jgi:peptidoglycan hydrolase-like protein with peptidoglycan-binding domain
MPNGWLDPAKYERLNITSCTGPGTQYDGYAWSIVLHSTESPPGSIDGINSLFRSKPCYAPHFTIDPMGSRRRVQYIPWTWSACALRGGRDGYQTNRGRAVQVEICGYANDAPGWPDDCLYQIADWIVDCMGDGVPINPHNIADMTQFHGVLATESAPQRLSPAAWKGFDGITAHVQIPYNDHWDCGRINSLRVRDLVLEILAGQGRPIPPPTGSGTAPQGEQPGMLQKGMSGGIVMHLQELMIGMGYDCGSAGADGVFGDATDAAVRRLQADHGLTVDGIAGPQVNHVIAQAYAWANPRPTPPPPNPEAPPWPGRYFVLTQPMLSGDDVRLWQRRMQQRGWRIGIDGYYGLESLGCCKSFQSEKGLTVDGVVGPSTWNATWSAPIS